MRCLLGLAVLCVCARAFAAESATNAASSATNVANLPLKALGNGLFELGTVRLSKPVRSVSFPGKANIVADLPVEYGVVFRTGKTHETLFTTDAKAQDIHLAMLLLGVRPAMTNAFPEDLESPPPGEKVTVEVSWTNGGTRVSRPMEELITSRQSEKPLPRGPWIYNGSNFSEGAFTAQRDGSIVSIHIDPDALVNNPRPGRENDDLHIPNTNALPPNGTLVEITIRIMSVTNMVDGASNKSE